MNELILTDPAGFLQGIIFTFAYIGSLFNSEITLYEINNNGDMYHTGLVI